MNQIKRQIPTETFKNKSIKHFFWWIFCVKLLGKYWKNVGIIHHTLNPFKSLNKFCGD